jgi:hypothetical protein
MSAPGFRSVPGRSRSSLAQAEKKSDHHIILEVELHTIPEKPARMSMRRFLKVRYERDDEYCRIRVLDSVVVAGRTAYAAMEWVMKDNDRRQVVGVVLRLERGPMPKRKTIIAQEMIESMMPSDSDCPHRILRLLSSTDDPQALEWRQRCRTIGAAAPIQDRMTDRP